MYAIHLQGLLRTHTHDFTQNIIKYGLNNDKVQYQHKTHYKQTKMLSS